MSGMSGRDNTELTYLYERRRAVTAGIIEAAGATFLLLIAVKWFKAEAFSKGLVAGGGSIGLLLTPWLVVFVARSGLPVAQVAGHLSMVGGLVLLFMAVVPSLPVFVIGSIVSMATAAMAVPLMTQIYQENYPAAIRGRLFSRTIMIRIAAAALFSDLAGRFLSGGRLHLFQWLLVFFAFSFFFAGLCLYRCPSRPLTVAGGTHLLRAWSCLREDRVFFRTLICWMLMGFANLMMFPLRVEYLANPQYGLALSITLIALYTGVIPNLARLVLSPVWGWLFDHMNFFMLRVVLNMGFALGILTFFMSTSTTGLVLGALVFGVSNAGGDVAWNLWVTKFAPPDRVADYMSVHTFFTGVRGVLAPLVSFHLLHGMSMGSLGILSTALIIAASLMLLPEVRTSLVRKHPVAH
jgi:lipid-A-disaccharide synthase-like uncharacterized protein